MHYDSFCPRPRRGGGENILKMFRKKGVKREECNEGKKEIKKDYDIVSPDLYCTVQEYNYERGGRI